MKVLKGFVEGRHKARSFAGLMDNYCRISKGRSPKNGSADLYFD